MTHPDNAREIEKVRQYAENVERELNGLDIFVRKIQKYPFDTIALAMISKAFAVAKACFRLLESGFPDEAFGLVRTLVEIALNLRFITQDRALQEKRSRDFIEYALVTKTYWLYGALQQFAGRKEEQEIRDYAKQLGISPDPKSARRHWSGLTGFVWEVGLYDHPLDGPAVSEQHKKMAYAVDYHQTSAHVHYSVPAIDNYFVDEEHPYRVGESTGDYHQPSQSTLFIILIYLHAVIAYALFGLNLDRPEVFNTLFSETLGKLEPLQTLHHEP